MSSDFEQLLPIYYKRLFPHQLMFEWLSTDEKQPNGYFSFREFSFTLKDDIYIRYLSFETPLEMEREICRRMPYKIDIGAFYTLKPKNHKMAPPGAFRALQKELVFDIDMTDYDDVRYCCSEAKVCIKCWRLMVIAIKFIDECLRKDFGFSHLLWVFSGRRGIHCWVCDDDVRKYDQSIRSAICDYLSIPKLIDRTGKRGLLPAHPPPLIYRAISFIDRHFAKFAEEQKLFKEDKQIKDFLQLLPDDETMKVEIKSIIENKSVKNKWENIKKILASCSSKNIHKLDWEIMLHYCYPRLDVNVSTAVNHLLKSPFCAHPKTSNICVPIDVEKLDSFDPFAVPNLSELNEEMNSFAKQAPSDDVDADVIQGNKENDADGGRRKYNEYKFTSMKKYIDYFETFVRKGREARLSKVSAPDIKLEF